MFSAVPPGGGEEKGAECRSEHRPLESSVLDPGDLRRRHELATEDIQLGPRREGGQVVSQLARLPHWEMPKVDGPASPVDSSFAPVKVWEHHKAGHRDPNCHQQDAKAVCTKRPAAQFREGPVPTGEVMTAPMIAVSSASTMEALASTFAVQSVMALWVRHANSAGVIVGGGDAACSVAEVFRRLAKILNMQRLPDSFGRIPVAEAGLLAGSARAALVVREPVAE
jgi:hypothetical protein